MQPKELVEPLLLPLMRAFVMGMRDDEIELQIQLVELQIDHEYLTSAFVGNIAIEFSALLGLGSIYYGLMGQLVHYLIPSSLIVMMWVYAFLIYYTAWTLKKQRAKLKSRIEEIGKRFEW